MTGERPPPPLSVHLMPHDPAWSEIAAKAAARLAAAADAIDVVHHIGSTAIAGLPAKPIVDLLAVATSLDALENDRAAIEALGYRWHGANGIARRRFCTMENAVSGQRLIHLHIFPAGDRAIRRHLAFRDYLRASPALIREYAAIKRDCAAKHPENSSDYSDCKADWIRRAEAAALRMTPQR